MCPFKHLSDIELLDEYSKLRGSDKNTETRLALVIEMEKRGGHYARLWCNYQFDSHKHTAFMNQVWEIVTRGEYGDWDYPDQIIRLLKEKCGDLSNPDEIP